MKAHRYRPDVFCPYPSSALRWWPWNMLRGAKPVFLARQALDLAAHQAHAWGSMIQTWRVGFDVL
jgi:hypothetical protein